jgi:hypothetical protein
MGMRSWLFSLIPAVMLIPIGPIGPIGAQAADFRAGAAAAEMMIGRSALDPAGDFSFSGMWGQVLINPSDGASLQIMAVECIGSSSEIASLSGSCTMTDRDGDVLRSEWHCGMTAPPQLIDKACEGRSRIVEGSGKFRSASGDNAMLFFLRPASPPNAPTGFAMWPAFSLALPDGLQPLREAIASP